MNRVVVFELDHLRNKLCSRPLPLDVFKLVSSSNVKKNNNLVLFLVRMSFNPCMKNVTRTFSHLNNITEIRDILSQTDAFMTF